MKDVSQAAIPDDPQPVYTIFGSIDFLRRAALSEVIRKTIGTSDDNMAYVEFEGESAIISEVLDECRTSSLFSPLRLICVRNADPFVSFDPNAKEDGKDVEAEKRAEVTVQAGKRPGAKAKRPTNRELLYGYLEKPCDTTVLVLECRTWPKNTKLYKRVDKIGCNIACNPPENQWEVMPWARRWANERVRQTYGCQLSSEAAEQLAELVGPNLDRLDMELAKLSTYVSPKTKIELNDVEELVGLSQMKNVFGIISAIASRNPPKALELWGKVLATDRNSPYRAVGGLAYGIRQLAAAKHMVQQGMSVGDAAKRAKIWGRPDGIQKQLDRFSVEAWGDHLGRLLQNDMGAKSGLASPQLAVEKFIVELCTIP